MSRFSSTAWQWVISGSASPSPRPADRRGQSLRIERPSQQPGSRRRQSDPPYQAGWHRAMDTSALRPPHRQCGRGFSVFPRSPGDLPQTDRPLPQHGPVPSPVARSHANIGAMLAEAGQLSEAFVDYAPRTTFQKLADAHPDVIQFRCSLASICTRLASGLLRLGRTDDARASCERAIGLYETLTQASPEITSPRSGLAEALLRSGQVRQTRSGAAGAAAGPPGRRSRRGLAPSLWRAGVFRRAATPCSRASPAGRAGDAVVAGETKVGERWKC